MSDQEKIEKLKLAILKLENVLRSEIGERELFKQVRDLMEEIKE